LTVVQWCQRMQRGAIGRAEYERLSLLRRSAIVIQCAVRIRQACLVLGKLKQEAKDMKNVAEERDKFRERMEQMRIEMERVKKEAEKEAEEAAKAKEEAKKVEGLARMEEELSLLKDKLASAQEQLEKEQQRAEEAEELAESRRSELENAQESVAQLEKEQQRAKEAEELAETSRSELEIAQKSIAQLETELEEAIAKDSDDESSTMGAKEMMLQNKLDESTSLARKQEREIKKLKSELENSSNHVSKPQSAESSDALQKELLSLRAELESTKNKLNMSQESNGSHNGSKQEEMENEIASLRKELKRAKIESMSNSTDSSPEYTSFASEMEVKKLREENEKLQGVLDEALAANSPTADSLSKEKKLKKEIAKLKEANKKILETAEEQFASLSGLEKENSDLRSEIGSLNAVYGEGMPGGADTFGDMRAALAKTESRLKAEKARAEEAVAREANLRTQIAEMRLMKPQQNGDNLMAHQTINEGEACDDVATLQYEIARLSNELLFLKEKSRSPDTFSADDMIRKFDEVKLLSEAGMQKDLEIEKLKMRVKTQDAELKAMREEVTEEDLTFGMRDYSDDDNDITAAENEGLRSLNEQLSRQLDLYKKESEEAKTKLKDEKHRSEMEMKAFSVALRGVDDLRSAAEKMSQELHIIKKNGYVPSNGITGEDTSQNIRNAMSAVNSMAVANQSIDHPAVSESNAVQRRGFSLWNTMNAVMGPGNARDISESNGVMFGDASTSSKKSSHKHKSKKKKKRGDSGSVISSFF